MTIAIRSGLRFAVIAGVSFLCLFQANISVAATCAPNADPIANCEDLTWSSGSIINSYTISGSTDTSAVQASGDVGVFTNLSPGLIDATTGWGIKNTGTITSIENAGAIRNGSVGIYNQGSISSISNSGEMSGSNSGMVNWFNSTVGTITNSGSIIGTNNGLLSYGTISTLTNTNVLTGTGASSSGITNIYVIGALTNSGNISGGAYGINNSYTTFGGLRSGSVTDLVNTGTITSQTGGTALFNNQNATITTFTNGGNVGTSDGVSGDSKYGILNAGSITQLSNTRSGSIIADTSTWYNAGIQNDSTGIIGTVSNDGILKGGSPYSGAITNAGSITTIENTYQITGTNGIYNTGTIGTINNTGSSAVIDSSNQGIYNEGTINRIYNSGTFQYGYNGIANVTGGSIDDIENDVGGQIYALDMGIYNEGTIGTVTNKGTLFGGGGLGIVNLGNITSVTNQNLIQGSIQNSGTIGSINNSGIIDGTINSSITNFQAISTITNTGSMYNGSGWADINNTAVGATITTLNNGQGTGNTNGALKYAGALPTNYNIIVNNSASYGKLDGSLTYGGVTGTTNFGIYNGSTLTKGTYSAVLSGLSSSNVSSATRSGIYNGTAWTLALESDSTSVWDLIVQSSATNTLASVQQNSNGLVTVYNQQTAAYQAALSYDCQVYDENNLCVSVGGRYTYAGPSPSSNQQAGLVILGFKPVQTFRLGAFADQSVNISTPSGFSQSKTSPMWGFFAKWHKNKDETGLGVQASVVTSSSSLTATRPQLFNTEAGSGTTQFNGQGYQLTTNYHQPVTNNTSVVPYLGLRYSRINAGAYTENTTATVTSPLSYNAMAQNTFSAIAGLGVRSHLAEKLTGTASVGIQQNLNYSMGNYAGTSNITGLESFSVQMPGNVNSMATATAGMFYDINKRERVGLNVLWQQQPFIATNTTTALATYTIGF